VADGLVVEALAKRYPNGALALHDVSLAVEPGTFLVLLGPSGSGKTTMLRTLAGIERATSGRLWIGGRVVAEPGVHLAPERRNLSMVFQDYALWPHMTARDNVAYALRRRGIPTAARRERALAMLGRVGLGQLADRFPGQLSGGEQQRVALARALVADTGVVLCDEPLSNLDADLRERMRVEISALVRDCGTTTVYITHDQAEAFALADRVGVLDAGRLVQFGTPEDIYQWPATSFVARFTGSAGEMAVEVTGPPDADRFVPVRPLGVRASQAMTVRASSSTGVSRYGQLVVRPRAVQICDPDSPQTQAVGVVADVAFRGGGYELVIDLGEGRHLRGVHSPWRLSRGEPVGVHLDPAGAIVYNDTTLATLDEQLSEAPPPKPVKI
jgi:iron(III) transport system ATP-binding protein